MTASSDDEFNDDEKAIDGSVIVDCRRSHYWRKKADEEPSRDGDTIANRTKNRRNKRSRRSLNEEALSQLQSKSDPSEAGSEEDDLRVHFINDREEHDGDGESSPNEEDDDVAIINNGGSNHNGASPPDRPLYERMKVPGSLEIIRISQQHERSSNPSWNTEKRGPRFFTTIVGDMIKDVKMDTDDQPAPWRTIGVRNYCETAV